MYYITSQRPLRWVSHWVSPAYSQLAREEMFLLLTVVPGEEQSIPDFGLRGNTGSL